MAMLHIFDETENCIQDFGLSETCTYNWIIIWGPEFLILGKPTLMEQAKTHVSTLVTGISVTCPLVWSHYT
ncbi:hypothetical protein HanIR_Chr03g0116661 [Helianthus annuus]|nr:hypothetical protein HanIR_Chr03g0116661 [Helianthus annuus]